LKATAESLTDNDTVPVDISLIGYVYDSAADRFITLFSLADTSGAVETGFPLTITVMGSVLESALIPLGGLYADAGQYYVYSVENTQTMWGTESVVRKKIVSYVGSNFGYASVIFLPGEGAAFIACYPTRTIRDGDTVKVAS
jgi:hypothetical protein